MFAKNNNIPSEHMDKALKTNRYLQEGKEASAQMSPKARAFCAWMIGNRKAQLDFLSLHVKFFTHAKRLLDTEKLRPLSMSEENELRQIGTLAALAALWLWVAPLRISNALNLTIFGDRRWLFLPDRKRDYALLLVPGVATKTKRAIRKKISRNQSQGIEIIEWYIKNIRPRYPRHVNSLHLFPGYCDEMTPIQGETVRPWLKKFCHHVNFYPMTPHWFRHGVASLFLKSNPGAYTHAGRILDDTPMTVQRYYGFLDEESLLEEAQEEWLRIAGFSDKPSVRGHKPKGGLNGT